MACLVRLAEVKAHTLSMLLRNLLHNVQGPLAQGLACKYVEVWFDKPRQTWPMGSKKTKTMSVSSANHRIASFTSKG